MPDTLPSANPILPEISAIGTINATECRIQATKGKGRGVFATRSIPTQTVVEVSPVLLFSEREYEDHGKYTRLHHYTFKWRDGRMALALGLGSLFNHSQSPNISFLLDGPAESIRFTTMRQVSPGEELCIFYGHKLWFEDADGPVNRLGISYDVNDGWGGLSRIGDENEVPKVEMDVSETLDPKEIIPEDELPFARIRITPDEEEEEDPDSVRTVDAWVVDIVDGRHTAAVLKWLKTSGYDSPALGHLKRIRKVASCSTLLLTMSLDTPALPAELKHSPSAPYLLPVPKHAALTPTSLQLKNLIWPTVFAPRRKHEPEAWSRGKVSWAQQAIRHVINEAREALKSGNLPVAAYVPLPFRIEESANVSSTGSFVAHDLRVSTAHPLRHAIMNVIRQVGNTRSIPAPSLAPSGPVLLEGSTHTSPESGDNVIKNGQNYLLTSLTLFTTHEPCIMCSMALLHSRVKEVIYIFPMARTGGCGGSACLPKLPSVNHRFSIGRWKYDAHLEELRLGEDIDA